MVDMDTKRIIRSTLIPPAILVFMAGVGALVDQIPAEYLVHVAVLVAWIIVSVIVYEWWK